VSAATAVVPYEPLRRRISRAEGGFDFFGAGPGTGNKPAGRGRQERPARPELAAAPEPGGDVADVARREAGQVIDLTEHDETESLDVRELRAQSS
jgi:hypothetical protein